MAVSRDEADGVSERFRVALDLFVTGEAIIRQRIRRQNPELDEAGVTARVRAWLQTRHGAQHGDGIGRPVSWPRTPTP